MSARQPIFNHLVAPLTGGPVMHDDAKQMLDAYRAEVLTVTADFLAEIGTPITGIRTEHERGVMYASERLRRMVEETAASGAAPAPAQDFFQPNRTYQRRRWLFQCLAVAPNPFNGEVRAVGYLYRPGEPAAATALDPDDWAQGGWAAAAAGGGR